MGVSDYRQVYIIEIPPTFYYNFIQYMQYQSRIEWILELFTRILF